MSKTTTVTYDFDEDALGLGDFITKQLDAGDADEVSPIVYVENDEGEPAARAEWIVETLTDGSKTATLRIIFGDQELAAQSKG
jgi:hypothetical protein